MQEYINLNHMREINDFETNDAMTYYYLSHHAVCKETSTITKLRVVFDVSCKSTSGLSLNDGRSDYSARLIFHFDTFSDISVRNDGRCQ